MIAYPVICDPDYQKQELAEVRQLLKTTEAEVVAQSAIIVDLQKRVSTLSAIIERARATARKTVEELL
jgi:hypothetical protein